MSREETKQFVIRIASAYPTFKPNNPTETIDMWASMLKDIPFNVANKRLDEHIATSAFVPTIADILKQKKNNEIHNYPERDYDYEILTKELLSNNQH